MKRGYRRLNIQHICTIQDKGSQNGTYINEERLSEVKYTTYLYNTRQRQPEWYYRRLNIQHICTIQDIGSQNDTYVNEERLSEVKYTTYLYNTRQR